MEEIFHRTSGMWRPGPSSIYPALVQLEEEGYIEPVITQQKEAEAIEGRAEKTKRPYRICKKGMEVLKDYERFRKEWVENMAQLKKMRF